MVVVMLNILVQGYVTVLFMLNHFLFYNHLLIWFNQDYSDLKQAEKLINLHIFAINVLLFMQSMFEK